MWLNEAARISEDDAATYIFLKILNKRKYARGIARTPKVKDITSAGAKFIRKAYTGLLHIKNGGNK